MLYNEFSYLWIPRPDNVILPGLLNFYENRQWITQIKKNGACTLWAISPDKKITIMNRHNDVHKGWVHNEENSAPFMDLPNKWYVFTGEVLHLKTPHIKDTFYIFDMLVCEGEYLVGKTFEQRATMLYELFKTTHEADHAFHVNNKVWLAKNYDIGFEKLYKELTDVSDEGLVLKNPKAELAYCLKQNANNHWMVKCRKGHKNYGY